MKSLIFCSLFIMTACSSHYEVHTNLDKENFTEYFKPSQVRLVQPDSIPAGSKSINSVVGMSCQYSETDKPANHAEARTQAKRAAADLGANGVVIDVCEEQLQTQVPECYKLLTCYGRALQLPEPKK